MGFNSGLKGLILTAFFGAEGNYGLLLGLNYGLNEATLVTCELLFACFYGFFLNIFELSLK
jgi:hypothetical protein